VSRRSWIGLGVLLVLALPWLLDVLIRTDQERVEDLFRDLAEAGSQKDVDRALTFLTADFHSTAARLRAADPDDLARTLERWLADAEEVRLEFNGVDLEGERPVLEASVKAWLGLRTRGLQGGGVLKARCTLRFEEDGVWRVAALTSLELTGGF